MMGLKFERLLHLIWNKLYKLMRIQTITETEVALGLLLFGIFDVVDNETI
jgi:hypothetical protein